MDRLFQAQTDRGAPVRFFFITNSPDMAQFVTANGVDRIFVDLEIIGKVERQGHLDTVISHHRMQDVAIIRQAVPDTDLMVRLNPVNGSSQSEIDQAIDSGADIIMLPMFRTLSEVNAFIDMIKGRCKLCLLVETYDAMQLIPELVELDGIDEFHIGLNDLSLDMNLKFMFEPFPLGHVDRMSAEILNSGKQFGIGGLARADEGLLPARLLLGEHVRLGSTAAILSRTFHRRLSTAEEIRKEMDFALEIKNLQEIESFYINSSKETLEKNRIETWRIISEISALRSEKIA